MVETLTELSQRNEAFWIGLALFLLGVLIDARGVDIVAEPDLSNVLILVGGGLLMLRLFVGIYRLLKTTAEAGAVGYDEGKEPEK